MNDIISEIKTKYTNKNTIKYHIVKALKELKYKGVLSEYDIEQQTIGRDEIMKIKNEIENVPNEAFERKNKLEKLRKIWTEFDDKTDTVKKYKLIVGLYIWIPALRTDFVEAEISENKKKIIIKKMVKEHSHWPNGIIINVPTQLKPYISYWDTMPKNSNSFIQTLKVASNAIFNEKFGIGDYRKIYTEWGFRKLNQEDNKKLAKNMNHSFDVHMSYYMAKTKVVYK